MQKLIIIVLAFYSLRLTASSLLPDVDWDIAASGWFTYLDAETEQGENIQFLLGLQWYEGENHISSSSKAILEDTAELREGDQHGYIFFMSRNDGLLRVLYSVPLEALEARWVLEELGLPNYYGAAIHGFQVYSVAYRCWYWSPHFGLYHYYPDNETGIGFSHHDQLGWITMLPGNPRAHWDKWFWHYATGNWMWTDLAIYPWIYDWVHGWVYLYEDIHPEIIWFYRLNEGRWVSVDARWM